MSSAYAWWLLNQRQKALLREQRLLGMFGGQPGNAPYFWVQEGSMPEGAAGAAKAAITPTHFVAEALDGVDVWSVVGRVLNG